MGTVSVLNDTLLTSLFDSATFSFVPDKHCYMKDSNFLNAKSTEGSLNNTSFPASY